MDPLRRRYGLGCLAAVVLALVLPVGLLVFQAPQLTGMLTLRAFFALPEGIQAAPATWKVFRRLIIWQHDEKVPADVEKQQRGMFGTADYLVVSLGDSTTFGTGVTSTKNWPFLFQSKMEGVLPGRVRVINAGSPGETVALGRERVERDVLRLEPDLVTVGYLINDGRVFGVDSRDNPRVMVDDDEFFAAMTAILDQLAAADVPTMLFTCHPLLPRAFRLAGDHWVTVQDVVFSARIARLKEIAAARDVVVADTYPVIQRQENASSLYLPDGIHLGVSGHQLMAEQIYAKWLSDVRPGI